MITSKRLQLMVMMVASTLVANFLLSNGQFSEEASLACLSRYAKFNGNHTACLRPNGCQITHWGVSKAEQKKIVEVHNHFRNLIASGNETRLGFPSASNMLKMEWDPELAYVAQMHANQCKFEHDCYDCRRTERYEFVGQNLYIYQTTRPTAEVQWPYVIKEWYDEIQIAPPVVAQSFDLFNLNIGHFTQIAWATTNRIGCGYVTYDVSSSPGSSDDSNSIFRTAQLYTCNYAPGGNFLGEKMYEDGNAASRCPARYRRSKRFTSLCEIARSRGTTSTNQKKKPKKGVSGPTRKVTAVTTVQRVSPVRTTITHFTSGLQTNTATLNSNEINTSSFTTNNFGPSTNAVRTTTTRVVANSPSLSTNSITDNTEVVEHENTLQSTPQGPLITFTPSNDGTTSTTVRQARPPPSSTTTTTTTTTRRISPRVLKPTSKPTTTTNTASFSLKPFSSSTRTTSPSTPEVTAVTSSSKRIIPWWDKWSSTNFRNNNLNKPTRRAQPTTRSPWRRWSNGWTTRTTTNNNYRGFTQPIFMRFEMSHNGTTTHSINQIF